MPVIELQTYKILTYSEAEEVEAKVAEPSKNKTQNMRETLHHKTRKDRLLRDSCPLDLARIVHWTLRKDLIVERKLDARSSFNEALNVSIVLEEPCIHWRNRDSLSPSEFSSIRAPILISLPLAQKD